MGITIMPDRGSPLRENRWFFTNQEANVRIICNSNSSDPLGLLSFKSLFDAVFDLVSVPFGHYQGHEAICLISFVISFITSFVISFIIPIVI